MAYHKILLPGVPLPAGINRGFTHLNHKLYFFGGYDGQGYSDKFQIFDLKLNIFEDFIELSSSNRPSMRHYHYMSSINPNYILIYGGVYKDQIFDDSFLFNTETYNWEKITESKSPGKRYGACGTYIGKFMYVVAGFGNSGVNTEQNLDDVWTFDYVTREWNVFHTIGSDKPNGVGWSCVNGKNRIFCLGNNMNLIFVLDVVSREWRTYSINGAIPLKLERYSFSINESGSIFLFGGLGFKAVYNEMYTLDQQGNEFIWHKLECTGNKPGARYSHSAVCIGEILFIIGGRHDSQYFNDIYVFNPNLGLRWFTLTAHGELPSDRVGHLAHYIQSSNQMLIHGGDSRGSVTNDLYLFDCSSYEWTKALYKGESPSLAFHSCVFDAKRSQLIVFGGGNLIECFSSLYCLSVPELEWKQMRVRKNISPRAGHNAFLLSDGDSMVVFGGFIPVVGYSNEVWRLSISSCQWDPIIFGSVAGEVPVGRISASCTVYRNCAYVVGGTNAGVVLDDLWKLNLDSWLWERITIYEKNPGGIYGHNSTLIDSHVFMLTSESVDTNGNLVHKPSNGMLWSLNLSDTVEWSMYKVEGTIPPKRFHSAVLIDNDIIIYGGGPDSNVYQLNRNDVDKDSISENPYKDFIFPYMSMNETKNSNSESSEEEEKFLEFSASDIQSKLSKSSKGSKESKGSKVSKRTKKSNSSKSIQGKSINSYQNAKLISRKKKMQ